MGIHTERSTPTGGGAEIHEGYQVRVSVEMVVIIWFLLMLELGLTFLFLNIMNEIFIACMRNDMCTYEWVVIFWSRG